MPAAHVLDPLELLASAELPKLVISPGPMVKLALVPQNHLHFHVIVYIEGDIVPPWVLSPVISHLWFEGEL